MFQHVKSQDVDLDGITIMGEVTVAPAVVVKRFGRPSPGEGYKISGEYAFTNDRGEAFVLHDWLCTNLYHHEDGLTPEAFWAMADPFPLSISSLDLDTSEFAAWLQNELRTVA
jgi:hypothetical protein